MHFDGLWEETPVSLAATVASGKTDYGPHILGDLPIFCLLAAFAAEPLRRAIAP
jgi:hypothetical protein